MSNDGLSPQEFADATHPRAIMFPKRLVVMTVAALLLLGFFLGAATALRAEGKMPSPQRELEHECICPKNCSAPYWEQDNFPTVQRQHRRTT